MHQSLVKMEPLVKTEQSPKTSTSDCEIIEDGETIRGLQERPEKTRQASLTDSKKQDLNVGHVDRSHF